MFLRVSERIAALRWMMNSNPSALTSLTVSSLLIAMSDGDGIPSFRLQPREGLEKRHRKNEKGEETTRRRIDDEEEDDDDDDEDDDDDDGDDDDDDGRRRSQ